MIFGSIFCQLNKYTMCCKELVSLKLHITRLSHFFDHHYDQKCLRSILVFKDKNNRVFFCCYLFVFVFLSISFWGFILVLSIWVICWAKLSLLFCSMHIWSSHRAAGVKVWGLLPGVGEKIERKLEILWSFLYCLPSTVVIQNCNSSICIPETAVRKKSHSHRITEL